MKTKNEYKIFEGFDHLNNKSIYQVTGTNNDYVGEWHVHKSGALNELKKLDGGNMFSIGDKITISRDEILAIEKTIPQLSYVKVVGSLGKISSIETEQVYDPYSGEARTRISYIVEWLDTNPGVSAYLPTKFSKSNLEKWRF